jgi:hypothetical protein
MGITFSCGDGSKGFKINRENMLHSGSLIKITDRPAWKAARMDPMEAIGSEWMQSQNIQDSIIEYF